MKTITDIINACVVSQKMDFMGIDVGLSTVQKQDLWYDLKTGLFNKYTRRQLTSRAPVNMNEFKVHMYNVINRYVRKNLNSNMDRHRIDYVISTDGDEKVLL